MIRTAAALLATAALSLTACNTPAELNAAAQVTAQPTAVTCPPAGCATTVPVLVSGLPDRSVRPVAFAVVGDPARPTPVQWVTLTNGGPVTVFVHVEYRTPGQTFRAVVTNDTAGF